MKKYQKDFDYSYTLGAFLTIELLQQRPKDCLRIFYSSKIKNNSELFGKIEELCKLNKIPFVEDNKVISKVSAKENIFVVGQFFKYESKLATNRNTVVLYHPSDMGNLGTIIRTCLGFGIQNIALISPAVDIFDPKVVRSSMGSLFKINWQYFENIESFIEKTTLNLYLFDRGGQDISHMKFIKPFGLVFGNEAEGLSQALLTLGKVVSIPQSNLIDSYNLAISVGIGLYGATRD